MLVALAILAAACMTGCAKGAVTTQPPQAVSAIPVSPVVFASLETVPPTTVSAAYKGPSTPHSLKGVRMSSNTRSMLRDPKTSNALQSHGFVVVPSDNRQFYMAYTSAPYDGNPVYVTTDVAYHMWHLAFDKMLRSLEQNVLLPKLERLVGQALANADKQSKQLAGSPLASDSLRVKQLMQVDASLLGLPAGKLDPPASKEIALIRAHSQVAVSPITGETTDYSLYTPRGHYTRTPELSRYFLGMTVLGQSAFPVAKPSQLRRGVLASRLVVPQGLGDRQTEQLWKDLYEPTAFLVGTADDYTPFELAASVETVTPGAMGNPAKLTDADLAKIGSALLHSRPVKIDPENASVRLMGVRFVVDSFVLDQLVYPNVGTKERPRLIASAMDLAAAFGSDFAYDVQKDGGQTQYARYDDQLKSMQTAIANRPQQAWGSTVYAAWLWSFQPAWSAHGSAFPDYMRTPEWAAKDTQTGLGSYAELKHDTVLYAKQYVAEGEGPPASTWQQNWVEPDPAVYDRLAAMATLARNGLSSRKLIGSDTDKLLGDLIDMYSSFSRIAQDELAAKPISAKDKGDLADIGSTLEGLWWQTADQGSDGTNEADNDAAIVADIGRADGQVVEVATGRIGDLLVVVPDGHGGFEVARGGVYSYHEFLQPVSNRLNDDTWRRMLHNGEAQPRPAWENVLFAK